MTESPTHLPGTPVTPVSRTRGRRTLLLIALVTIAPVIASYGAYYFFPRDKQANYGALLPTAPAPALFGKLDHEAPFALTDLKGQWVLAVGTPGRCDAGCAEALYATRQARTMQGKEQGRITRVLLVAGDELPAPEVLADHPGLVAARVPAAAMAAWPAGPDTIYLLDPLGNLVLAFPRNPDIKALARDLSRLLRASRIG